MQSVPLTSHRVGFYAGTFDPVTIGHLDIMERASRLVDKLIIGVAQNLSKNPLMSLEDRLACVQEVLPILHARTETKFVVIPFDSLLVDAVRKHGATLIFRGLRVMSDFDYEIQMSGVNKRLDDGIESVFLMASERTQFISSSLVREIARYGGDISEFVTPETQVRLLACLQRQKQQSATETEKV